MSKGNPILSARLPVDLVNEVTSAIRSRNTFSKRQWWDIAAYLRYVVRSDLKHRERSRKPRTRRGREQNEMGFVANNGAAAGVVVRLVEQLDQVAEQVKALPVEVEILSTCQAQALSHVEDAIASLRFYCSWRKKMESGELPTTQKESQQ